MRSYQELQQYYDRRSKRFDPLEKRLAGEHLKLAELIESREDMDYSWEESTGMPPRKFLVSLNGLRSIIGIDDENRPVFGRDHKLEIRLTGLFPVEPPVCYMRTPVWHPNIQGGTGPYKGRICGNNSQFGAHFSLEELIWRIRDMLSYKIYHAKMYYPFPEDEVAARWVIQYGEKLKYVKKGEGILIDENGVRPKTDAPDTSIKVII